MATTLILKCPNCNRLILATKTQKTKTCPYCSSHINLLHAQRVASAENAYEASEKLKELKTQKGFNQKPT